jgi:hypothetical protein
MKAGLRIARLTNESMIEPKFESSVRKQELESQSFTFALGNGGLKQRIKKN